MIAGKARGEPCVVNTVPNTAPGVEAVEGAWATEAGMLSSAFTAAALTWLAAEPSLVLGTPSFFWQALQMKSSPSSSLTHTGWKRHRHLRHCSDGNWPLAWAQCRLHSSKEAPVLRRLWLASFHLCFGNFCWG